MTFFVKYYTDEFVFFEHLFCSKSRIHEIFFVYIYSIKDRLLCW